jgi:CDP-paratose 2-epimerase
MDILVTGGCGFVGAALCRRLREESAAHAVTALDSLRRRGSETNRVVLEGIGVRFVHGDVRLPSDIAAVGPFDWVIDAAAEPSVLAGTAAAGRGASRRQLVEHNLVGTINLLEAAAGWNAGVVILSTSRVYSIPAMAGLPLVEVRDAAGAPAYRIDTTKPLPRGAREQGLAEAFDTEAPVSLYGGTKLASETLAREYAFAAGTPLIIDRCGVMAGAGQFGRADQGIFSWWIHSWAARRPLSYIGFGGRGLQVRDCLHPEDLGDLLVRQMAAARAGAPELVNVSGGSASATSLAQLSAWCAGRFGPHPVGSAAETRPYDVPWVVLDHGLASEKHGWKPARGPEAIFEEIAAHAARHPHWLETCS